MFSVNTINDRVKFIKNLIGGDKIKNDINIFDKSLDKIMDKDSLKIKKKFYNFTNVIDLIGGKLMYIKSGTSGHTFKGTIHDGDDIRSYAVKVVAYPKNTDKYGELDDINRPENVEITILKMFSKLVLQAHTPHIILPIFAFNCDIKPFLSLKEPSVLENPKYKQFLERYKKGGYYDTVSILISEWANGGDLLDFLRNHYKRLQLIHWKVLIYQILSCLAVIQKACPTFRHNDLKANNILVQRIKKKKKDSSFLYDINGEKYLVPNIGIQLRLWDFDFACIPGYINNSKVMAEWTDKINVKPMQNRYYDIHYFFNTLGKKGFFPELFESPDVPDKIKEFVHRVVPDKYRVKSATTEKGRLSLNDEYTTPNKILKYDPLFAKFRQTN